MRVALASYKIAKAVFLLDVIGADITIVYMRMYRKK